MRRVGQRLEEGDDQDMLVDRERAPLVLDKVDAVQDRMRENVGAALGIPANWTELGDRWHRGVSYTGPAGVNTSRRGPPPERLL